MMPRLVSAVLPLAILAGCVLPPQGIDEAAIARFDNAIVSLNCRLITEPHFLAVEFQAGLTRDQVVEMIAYKMALEQAVALEAGGHQFSVEGCA